jgi:peroxiredoxin
MAATETPSVSLGWRAADFRLLDAGGRIYGLSDVRGPHGTLVMFICNHCPYVRAIVDRIVRDARDLSALGVGVVAIMPNDYSRYPDDAPDRMKAFATAHGFGFPYLIDETQAVARAYDAVCTPDFFGFNGALELQYRGRLDDSRTSPRPDARRELFEAMRDVAAGAPGPADQHPSIGCSIKWREAEA